MGLVIRSSTPAASNALNYPPMIGGRTGSPVAPKVSTLLTGLTTQMFVPEKGATRYVYLVDSAGNLNRADLQNPGAALVTIATASGIGATIAGLDILNDNSAVICTLSNNTVILIATASPYTITVLAGSGANAETDGTGTGAAFLSPQGVVVDVIDGLSAYVSQYVSGSNSHVRKIVLATGVVTTLSFVTGGKTTPLVMTKAGSIYFSNGAGGIAGINVFNGALKAAATPGGGYHIAIAVDGGTPDLYNFYYVRTIEANLYRANVAGASYSVIAALPHAVAPSNAPAPGVTAYFRTSGFYVATTAGELLNVSN